MGLDFEVVAVLPVYTLTILKTHFSHDSFFFTEKCFFTLTRELSITMIGIFARLVLPA